MGYFHGLAVVFAFNRDTGLSVRHSQVYSAQQ